ncbi:MAG: N-acetylmuramoyl-L-alanine amidase [Bacteroidota bacterium]|nr:N-acetylmuramoyl-L-alanine amidase [Bacteroidota bacterium]
MMKDLKLIFFKQKRYHKIIFLLIVLTSLCLNIYSQNNNNNYSIKTVVIDPGHGGKDSGALGKIAKEKDIVLAIAQKLGTYIEENLPDVNVIYTRTTDVFVPLHERAEIANKNKADLFISIHLNGNKNHRAFGTETYVMGIHKTDGNLEVAKKENAAILYEEDYTSKYQGFDPHSAESYIIFSFLQNTYLEQSLNYAAYVENEFETRALRKSRGVKQAGFLVLWQTTMPSVLIEAGFLTNPQEEKYLISKEGQEYIASSIYRAFKNYKNAIEAKSKFSTQIDSLEKYQNEDSPVFFKIQIASASNPIEKNDPFFKTIENIEEIKYNGMYKYTVGSSSDYNEINKLKNSIEDQFPDAFVIAIDSTGNIIPLQKALNIINN